MSKQNICSRFDRDIDNVKDNWQSERVIPYTEAYNRALGSYEAVLEERTRELERQRELFFMVAMVAGTAALSWGPAAAIVANGSRAFRGTIVLRAARYVGGVLNVRSHVVYRVLKNFTYGPLRDILGRLTTRSSKDLIRGQHVGAWLETNTSAGAGRRESESLSYRGVLEQTLLRIAGRLNQLSQAVSDTSAITESQAVEIFAAVYANSQFFQRSTFRFSGDHPLAGRPPVAAGSDLAGLAGRLEKTMWASWVIGQRRQASFPEHRVAPAIAGGHALRVPARVETSYVEPGDAVLAELRRLGVQLVVYRRERDSTSRALHRWAEHYLSYASRLNRDTINPYRLSE